MRTHKLRSGIAVLLAVMLLLCGCQSENSLKWKPIRTTIEQSDNSFGARYIFTLDEFTEKIEPELESFDIKLSRSGWEILIEKLVDDNGVSYRSYCCHAGTITFTVATENDNGKVMNIGCGCDSALLEDEDYRNSFVQLCAVIAQYAGGYEEKSIDFFAGVFIQLLDGEDDILCYGETLYIKSVDNAATVLMTAPCSEDYINKNHYQMISES